MIQKAKTVLVLLILHCQSAAIVQLVNASCFQYHYSPGSRCSTCTAQDTHASTIIISSLGRQHYENNHQNCQGHFLTECEYGNGNDNGNIRQGTQTSRNNNLKAWKIISNFPSAAHRIKNKLQSLKILRVSHRNHFCSNFRCRCSCSCNNQAQLDVGPPPALGSSQHLLSSSLLITNTFQSIFLSQKNLKKIFLLSTFVFITLNMIRDMLQTKKRQRIDATSEWGRYADRPSVRGRALFALMGKMIMWTFFARIVNLMPGGEYSLLSRRRENNQVKNNIVNGNSNVHDNLNGVDDNDKSSSSIIVNGSYEDESTVNNQVNDSYFVNERGQNNHINDNSSIPTSWASRKSIQIRKHSGQKLAEGLLRLGPLYIKIGQIISCRDKLLPEEWKVALERLQDRVPAKSGKEAFELAYQAYDGNSTRFHSIFSDFDDVPIAAASLGQVHRAKLRSNNATVAIKLQRSRLRDIYDKDLALMNKIAKAVDKFAGKVGQVGGVKQSWENIFKDAETILYREIDYRDEANNAIRFASDFGIGLNGEAIQCTAKSLDGKVLPSASDWMRTPFIYSEYSTEKILVMEYVPSIKISDDEKLKAAGITTKDKENLAECLSRSYLRQFCVNRFFSTDPHPGNLGVEIVKSNDKGKVIPRLVFYDFGQACSLNSEQAGGILDVIEGIVDNDVDNCVNAFQRMGVLVDGADLDKVRKKVRSNFESGLIQVKNKRKRKSQNVVIANSNFDNENVTKITTSANTNPTMADENEKVDDAEIMSFFTLPAEYAFVARAISQMDGVGKNLDPDFDFISASAPYLVEIKGGERYIADEVKKRVAPLLNWQIKLQKKLGFEPRLKVKIANDNIEV